MVMAAVGFQNFGRLSENMETGGNEKVPSGLVHSP
jgi:hypothetical protein